MLFDDILHDKLEKLKRIAGIEHQSFIFGESVKC